MSEKICEKIERLETELAALRHELFVMRLKHIVRADISAIEDLEFIQDGQTWELSYVHRTSSYNKDAYNYNADSESESDDAPKSRVTNVAFGYNDRYYLRGTAKNRFNIYRNNSKNILRIINRDYQKEFDLDTHLEKIRNYADNPDIPEWVALRVVIFMIDHDWTDDDIIECFLSP